MSSTEGHSESLTSAAASNVQAALAEDLADVGDITAELIPKGTAATARVITRTEGIFCGELWAQQTCAQVDSDIQLSLEVSDGDHVKPNQTLLTATGRARSLLTAERTMLNFIQLLSGTATLAARYAQAIAHTNCQVLDTRKTIPGLRMAQKHAVACAGAKNHRIGLFDAFLIKENHIKACGTITAAVHTAKANHPGKPVEVEVERFDQLDEAIAAGADIVMLDNFSVAQTREGVERAAGRVKLEASGGITFETIRTIAETGVDYISIGDITKRVEPMDLSMRLI
ncbi:MAG: carboxylating nicotinate-nucleotide diphosphorylase [Pseudomonadaceae bacterium]|nr:carboxylating nicotinate-nucleotide diphosphorylase [Pseudomonadaceae bacterium]